MNADLTAYLLHQLAQLGVRDYCLCPGSRNAPFVMALSEPSEFQKTYLFYEERSAAFFALGRIRATKRPVVVVTTSGTAAGELLPAVMEARYAGLPLILVTADRPRSYRGTGAPQTAEQPGIFGVYAHETIDIAEKERPVLSRSLLSRPLHLNVCFDEPILDQRSEKLEAPLSEETEANNSDRTSEIKDFLSKAKNPLILVGILDPEDRENVALFLQQLGAPALIEAGSGLREDPRLAQLRMRNPARIMERAARADYGIDSVIRIGGVPTLRFWRDLENKCAHLPILSLSRLSFTGMARNSLIVSGNLSNCIERLLPVIPNRIPHLSAQRFIELSQRTDQLLEHLLKEEPLSEAGMVARLSQLIPPKSRVYLGNSLPIREWDLAASVEPRGLEVWASRGLNGIDGQISTFLGFAQSGCENWGIFGDLTALYDLQAPWILSQMEGIPTTIAVINNGGGKIFSRIYSDKIFQNPHSIKFEAWADLWGLEYENWTQIPDRIASKSSKRLFEIVPNEEATQRFWRAYDSLEKV